MLGKLHGIVVTAGLRTAVGGEMLDTGGHIFGLGQVVALESFDLCGTHPAVEQGVFAAGLHDAAPAGIADIVHHGGEGDLHTAGGGFLCCHAGAFSYHFGVEGTAQCQRQGEDGAEAVDHVHHEHHRDLVAVSSKMGVLNFPYFPGTLKIQHAAHIIELLRSQPQMRSGTGNIGVTIHQDIGVILCQLSDFLLESHLA